MLGPPTKGTGVTPTEETNPVRLWEDAIVDASDGHWCLVLDACNTKAQWNCISKGYIENQICKWKLRKSRLPSGREIRILVEEKVNTIDLAIMDKG